MPDAKDQLFRRAARVRRHWSPTPPVDYCTRRHLGAPAYVGRALNRILECCGVRDALGIFGVDADGGVAAIFIGVPVELQLLPPQSCTGSGAWLRT